MSSSSRSIAAARQKRAGEQSQPMNTSRPVTSISSQGAFAQQYQQQMMSQSIPINSKNVRVAQNRSQFQGGRGGNQNIQQQQQLEQDQSTKISVSNAIGLITLRLGKLEKMINEVSEEGGFSNNENNNSMSSIPPNMKLVTHEVFENIVNRLNLLESKIINYQTEMSDIKTTLDNFSSLLSSFINDTNDKFVDYENALTEIENNFVGENNVKDENENEMVEIVEEQDEEEEQQEGTLANNENQ
jgi:hypothetical protein